MTRCILLTGFEPFGGEKVNPSQDVASALAGTTIAGNEVVAEILPCEFGRSVQSLRAAIERYRPVLVLALGQAGGRVDLSLERIAINVDDARIADNAGAAPIDTPVVDDAPAAYFSTLPIKAMAAALRAAGIPASVSQSAGTFVCNHVFYGLQHRLAGSAVRSGFMHLPLLPGQAAEHPGLASLPFETMVEGVRLALATALGTVHDVRISGGSIA
jgi:pyroglutamyl-peptidase